GQTIAATHVSTAATATASKRRSTTARRSVVTSSVVASWVGIRSIWIGSIGSRIVCLVSSRERATDWWSSITGSRDLVCLNVVAADDLRDLLHRTLLHDDGGTLLQNVGHHHLNGAHIWIKRQLGSLSFFQELSGLLHPR